VRKVVIAHQGEVSAQNARDGGLELTIRLPHWVG
jgi:two-component system OmpR family sensor kinase